MKISAESMMPGAQHRSKWAAKVEVAVVLDQEDHRMQGHSKECDGNIGLLLIQRSCLGKYLVNMDSEGLMILQSQLLGLEQARR